MKICKTCGEYLHAWGQKPGLATSINGTVPQPKHTISHSRKSPVTSSPQWSTGQLIDCFAQYVCSIFGQGKVSTKAHVTVTTLMHRSTFLLLSVNIIIHGPYALWAIFALDMYTPLLTLTQQTT